MVVPEAEHLAQLLAACIQANMTVHGALRLSFYHPVFEEGLRIAALRDAVARLPKHLSSNELHLCESSPEFVLQ